MITNMQHQRMKAWRLQKPGGQLALKAVPVPALRPGSVLVKIAATALVSYLKSYTQGALPFYNPPAGEFTIGSNAIGHIAAVGSDVYHLQAGQRVIVSPHITAHENVEDPAMILLGITAIGNNATALQAGWPDGTLAEYVLVPADAVIPAPGLEHIEDAQLAALSRFIVPFGGLLDISAIRPQVFSLEALPEAMDAAAAAGNLDNIVVTL